MSKLQNLFNPKSIAIVGASEEAGKVGNVIAKNILELGYEGEVFLVNQKYDTLFGRKCYKNLQEIEGNVDLAVIAIPAKFVNQVIDDAKDKIKNFVVISAGFGETDDEGRAREKELAEIAGKNGLNILGPNCLGFIIPALRLNASFAGGLPEAGNIAFVSQSGALAVALMDIARERNLKFSSIISVGNKMQLTESELLAYLNQDENTKVIGLYLEGIKDGKKFIEVAGRVAKNKPVLILKAGKTEQAQKAISSHTGALAGSDEIMDAIFTKTGVIRAQDIDEFLNFISLASGISAPKNAEVVVITNAGGLGVLTTDAFKDKKIKLAEISEKGKAKLRKFLPAESSVANPIDVLGDADEKRYAKTLAVVENENADTILCLLTPQDQTPVAKIAQKVVKFKEKSKKNVIAVFMGATRVAKAVKKLKENNIPNFFLSEQAVNVLDKYYGWQVSMGIQRENQDLTQIDPVRREKAKAIIAKAKGEGRSALLFSEAAELVGLYGIRTVETFSEDGENMQFPVVVKVDSDKVLHKTDKQGLILNIKDQAELYEAIAKIKENFPEERFLIQPMQHIKTELILGIKKDPIFGPIIVFGLGGIYTEVFKLVDFLVSPADLVEIKEKLADSRIRFLFTETRGQKAHNLSEMAEVLRGMVDLAREVAEISEFDINPLLIYNDGKAAVAVDVKVIFKI